MNSRRDCLNALLRTAAACALLPGVAAASAAVRPIPDVARGRGAVGALGAALATDPAATLAGRRLVLIELGGANDGLNTLVPWRDERYRALRPTLALDRADVLDTGGMRSAAAVEGGGEGDGPALHASLAPLMPLLERGEAAWVQGLGYPSPNRSHFTSIRYWETGGDGRRGAGPDGWLVHDLEHRLGRPVTDAHGISLDGGVGPFDSATGRWLTAGSVGRLATLRARGAEVPDDAPPVLRAMAARMNRLEAMMAALQDKVRRAPHVEPFAASELGARLQDVATLVVAGLDTPVYRVRLAGFDTHEAQRPRHAGLLDELALGVRGFAGAMRAAGEWERTLVLTYSEFGRRAAENESGGTDHGTAAPHLVAGGALGGGSALYGAAPDLGALDDEGDPASTLDYRALYERVLSGWFGIADNRFAAYRVAGSGGSLGGLLRPT